MADESTQAWRILEDALKLPTGERGQFLQQACADHPPLRAEIESLLRAVDRVDDIFSAQTLPPGAGVHEAVTTGAALGTNTGVPEGAPGASIGPYTLLSVLGEGGFGVVFLAERRKPMVQRVAVKVIKPGMDSARVIARFEQERQVLAMMDHPNIARVLDAGATPGGRPYFVMEYVKGEPITKYCDRQRLSIRQRLELFIPVCEAVQHAHNRGVIHRDLKPSNVLISVIDDKIVPKVIDFGVAKAITHIVTAGEIFTQQGMFVGTPEYMSPEQAEMGPTDIDTRTDVFSLGVMLYELLTGTLPLEGATLRKAGLAEIQRLIRETERPRPSTKLSQMVDRESATAESVAASRHMEIGELSRELRRELDWIPLKALRTDRTERYRSPVELADDIRNYLDGRAVNARPPSAWYTARKFVRRHRAGVFTAAVVVGAIVAGGSVATWKWQAELAARRREQAATARAELERDATDNLLGFVNTSVVGAAGGNGEGGNTPIPIPVSTLDRARDAYLSEFAGQTEMLRRLGATFSRAYIAAGQPERAEELIERVPRDADGQLDPELAGLLGEALFRERRADEAVPLLRQAVDAEQARPPADAAAELRLADLRSRLAGALKWSGDFSAARREYQAERALRAATAAPDAEQIRWVEYNLVLVDIAEIKAARKNKSVDDAEAQKRLEAALAEMLNLRLAAEKELGPESEQTLACAVEAGDLKSLVGPKDESIADLSTVVATMDEALGPRHWRTLESKGRLARIQLGTKQLAPAAALLETVLRGYRLTQGNGASDTITIARWLAMAQEKLGNTESAIAVLTETVEQAAAAGASPDELARAAEQIAKLHQTLNEHAAAESWGKKAAAWKAAAETRTAPK